MPAGFYVRSYNVVKISVGFTIFILIGLAQHDNMARIRVTGILIENLSHSNYINGTYIRRLQLYQLFSGIHPLINN